MWTRWPNLHALSLCHKNRIDRRKVLLRKCQSFRKFLTSIYDDRKQQKCLFNITCTAHTALRLLLNKDQPETGTQNSGSKLTHQTLRGMLRAHLLAVFLLWRPFISLALDHLLFYCWLSSRLMRLMVFALAKPASSMFLFVVLLNCFPLSSKIAANQLTQTSPVGLTRSTTCCARMLGSLLDKIWSQRSRNWVGRERPDVALVQKLICLQKAPPCWLATTPFGFHRRNLLGGF